ncbi:hypothetical protein ABIB57_003639 [Devosia sp. UYZn731]|uniref:hypothetical protein n=1 Tax=Devosia sp. UYZn731 TaxID=3156345 RepID=UPI00339A22F7
MAWVTVAQVNGALRLDLVGDAPFADDERTADITLKIAQAENIVLDFVQPKPDPAWTADTVPGRVTAAVIMLVGYLLDDESEAAQAALSGLAGGTLNAKNPVAALLWRLRTPTLA